MRNLNSRRKMSWTSPTRSRPLVMCDCQSHHVDDTWFRGSESKPHAKIKEVYVGIISFAFITRLDREDETRLASSGRSRDSPIKPNLPSPARRSRPTQQSMGEHDEDNIAKYKRYKNKLVLVFLLVLQNNVTDFRHFRNNCKEVVVPS
jgi:hypothetical protein